MQGAADAPTGRELFPGLSVFELAFLTVIADAMVRLRAGWDPERVYAFMDERVRVLLRSLNTCRAIDCEVERFADHWIPEQLAGLEERLAADVVKIQDRRVRRQYRQFFKKRMDELRETVALAARQ